MDFFKNLFQLKENQPQKPSNFWVKDSFSVKQHFAPNINLTYPLDLPSFTDIAQQGYSDPRVLLYFIKSQAADRPFTENCFNEFEIMDFNTAEAALDILCEKGLVEEKSQAEIFASLYSADELKTLLRKRGLKVSGKKEMLAQRLLDDGCKAYRRRYKHKLYGLTKAGVDIIQEEITDRNQAVLTAIRHLECMDFFSAVSAYNAYDRKWGYVHLSGKNHTIFANFDIPRSRFDFLANYPMNELFNSGNFKGCLRACLIAGLMRGEQNRWVIADDLLRICSEPIRCPGILDMYKREATGWEDSESLNAMFSAMQNHIESDPRYVLEYYISKVLYLSRQ